MIARGTAGGREPVGLFLAVEKGKQKQKHNVRTFRFIPPDTRYIRIWYIIRTWYLASYCRSVRQQ